MFSNVPCECGEPIIYDVADTRLPEMDGLCFAWLPRDVRNLFCAAFLPLYDFFQMVRWGTREVAGLMVRRTVISWINCNL